MKKEDWELAPQKLESETGVNFCPIASVSEHVEVHSPPARVGGAAAAAALLGLRGLARKTSTSVGLRKNRHSLTARPELLCIGFLSAVCSHRVKPQSFWPSPTSGRSPVQDDSLGTLRVAELMQRYSVAPKPCICCMLWLQHEMVFR